jgi:hypothetical protein
MTQAFNLSQLANFVNSAGKLDTTTGLVNTIPVSIGGTGRTTLASNAVLTGNGTSGVNSVSPGASGNILLSNGTSWTSQPFSAAGGFNASVVLDGYQFLPSGLLIQWKTVSSFASGASIPFPIAFPNNVFAIFAQSRSTGAPTVNNVIVVTNLDLANYALWATASTQCNIFVIGN